MGPTEASTTRAGMIVTTLEELAARDDEAIDVALGAALVAKDAHASLDPTVIPARLDALAEPLREEGLGAASLPTQAERLAHYLYGELGFRGNEQAYYDPRNSFLSDVLERRLGIPLTLGIVYVEVARRLGVEAYGVAFPGHFLVRLEQAGSEAQRRIVDPFFGGRLLEDDDIKRMLVRALGPNAELTEAHLARASSRAILLRLLTNLKAIYLERGDRARAMLALDRMVTLARGDRAGARAGGAAGLVNTLRERGLVAAKLGMREVAREDLAKVLELDPEARDAGALRAELAKITARPTMLN